MTTVEKLISQYDLQPHPEGGWYKQTYKSKEIIPVSSLPGRFKGDRVFSTVIYFLLEEGKFSAFHKIKSEECWHFYSGDPLHIYQIHRTGDLEIIMLGNNIENGESFQYVVPANSWFASRPAPGSK